ncbi:phage antirepressor KilAC domain-containing protein [Lactiplantibacillus plantarum]|uniref:phage regulatory protein/antirepressor Ant n=1 Tax=Lactiplantibacillus plantarum TaxID=1590 RepID=UPI001E2ADABC|nr:phage regulatory protein/antirepressor Ant [Lactiplantibacillus plantarum]MCC6117390.1 phage regulatory protein/antirepressor Ant [Lactiplantibacillus plantarum]MCW6114937.1 phage regulatory protein/antirepressor Ant [Lactiplantibacillus plantarum]MCW6126081.1 phage regulatory protein/antirepressor Ant [Lactiplantibacillus plantarum]UJL24457.1 phage antirepressor KilAC domain-containing protein [Lactiplantibacillus plantarum]
MNDLVIMKNKQAVTSSLQVAEVFEKNHRDVLEAIRTKMHSAEFSAQYQKMFVEGSYKDKSGKSNPMYYMNRDGFAFIVMGFTGHKADNFKLQYIKAFNEMEDQVKFQVPSTLPEALRLAADQAEKISVLQPKADYTDSMLANKGLETISMIAKNYGYSTREFNKLLHGLGIQYKQGKTWLLYAKYQDEGYTHVEPYEYTNSDGIKQVRNTMKWTQAGQKFLYDFLKSKGIMPLVEQPA